MIKILTPYYISFAGYGLMYTPTDVVWHAGNEIASGAAMQTAVSMPMSTELCAGCRLPIEDRFLLRVMDNSWHERCLQCSVCLEPLRQSCFIKDRRLLCRFDYDK